VDLVKGGPDWVDNDRFDVAAKADPATSESTSRLMLATLLAEQCKLAVHHAAPPTPVFVLTVGKRGSKLRPSTDDPARRQGCFGNDPMICHKVKMPRLIYVLKYATGNTPVVDETGLDGVYDFELYAAPPEQPAEPSTGASIFSAVERQLGLKLEGAKRPINTIVIDHVERPLVEN
jgi:uncharacterized protein (TIGR03435 family)